MEFKMKQAKNLYARSIDIKDIKHDADFMQFVAEMFTWNENNESQIIPENVKIINNHNRVEVHIFNFYSNTDNEYTSIGYIYKCSLCGEYELIVHDQPDYERYCFGCKEEFKTIGDSKNIEW